MKKIVMYLNQFFGQIGGEDKADYQPAIRGEKIGLALQLNPLLKGGEVTHTIVCGDNYMTEHTDEALSKIGEYLKALEFDLFIAGPAFLAGRYGVSCGQVCKYVQERFNVPAFACMNEENPGADVFARDIYILKGGDKAAKARADVSKMAEFANKFLSGEPLLWADAEGYVSRGVRQTVVLGKDQTAANRAYDMLMKKLRGEPFESELPITMEPRVPVAPPLKDTGSARIAFISTGGVVPADNPDKIPSASATRYGRYDISKLDKLEPGKWITVHGGYENTFANADPHVVMPLDALKALTREGKIGYLHPYYYVTTGNHTNRKEATRMAREILQYLKEDKIEAVIFGST